MENLSEAERYYKRFVADLSQKQRAAFKENLDLAAIDVQSQLLEKISEIEYILNTYMGSYGLTSDECQQAYLANKLKSFSHGVNGIAKEDLSKNTYEWALGRALEEAAESTPENSRNLAMAMR